MSKAIYISPKTCRMGTQGIGNTGESWSNSEKCPHHGQALL